MDRGFIYLNKTNFLNNLLFLKKSTKKNLCLVVKANAYGHGVEWAVNSAIKAGVAWFAVASVDEGVQVKEYANEARVLLLSEPSISQLEKIRINNLDLTVYNESFINALIDNGSTFNVHLKIDTGMHRLGCTPEKFKDIFRKIEESNLNLVGICTHFPLADTDEIETKKSIELFENSIADIQSSPVEIESTYLFPVVLAAISERITSTLFLK